MIDVALSVMFSAFHKYACRIAQAKVLSGEYVAMDGQVVHEMLIAQYKRRGSAALRSQSQPPQWLAWTQTREACQEQWEDASAEASDETSSTCSTCSEGSRDSETS